MKINIKIESQTLDLIDNKGNFLSTYPISSAIKGTGQTKGSYCTPLGDHIVRAKIGDAQPENTVFVGRRPTGEIFSPELAEQSPGRDWILTRILWLSGRELGFNRLGDVDTMGRYIYIHGSPDSVHLGQPGSIGCIRMRNADIVNLFDRIPAGTPVNISL